MSIDEFWYGDPELYYNYARAYENKLKQRQQEIWAIGGRVGQALSSTVLIAGLADKKILHQMPQYPECPYIDETPQTETDILLEKEKFITKMTNWVNASKRK